MICPHSQAAEFCPLCIRDKRIAALEALIVSRRGADCAIYCSPGVGVHTDFCKEAAALLGVAL